MARRSSIISEFIMFMREHKAYWIAPIIVVTLLLAGVIALGVVGGGAAAPFVYSLF